MTEKPYADKDLLRRLYWEEGLTYAEMAERLGCSAKTIGNWMDKFDIPARDPNEPQFPKLHNSEILKGMYVDDRMTIPEIADKLDCSERTVVYWLQKHDIETRGLGQRDETEVIFNKEWHDAAMLKRLYKEGGMTQAEVADELGCSRSHVGTLLGKYGIETRDYIDYERTKPAEFGLTDGGYEYWRAASDGERHRVEVHRLLAIAEGADPENVFGGYHIHHENRIPWDNRPENISVVTPSEHAVIHIGDR
jgi:DNA-binding CsgD family transcriptional regulator